MKKNWIFLDHEALAYIRKLRKEGKLDEAEKILKSGEPSQAVLDELRKISSQKARIAKRANDWEAVIRHLESYNSYANEYRWYCIRMVNAEPPSHSEQDQKLLLYAKEKFLR